MFQPYQDSSTGTVSVSFTKTGAARLIMGAWAMKALEIRETCSLELEVDREAKAFRVSHQVSPVSPVHVSISGSQGRISLTSLFRDLGISTPRTFTAVKDGAQAIIVRTEEP